MPQDCSLTIGVCEDGGGGRVSVVKKREADGRAGGGWKGGLTL